MIFRRVFFAGCRAPRRSRFAPARRPARTAAAGRRLCRVLVDRRFLRVWVAARGGPRPPLRRVWSRPLYRRGDLVSLRRNCARASPFPNVPTPPFCQRGGVRGRAFLPRGRHPRGGHRRGRREIINVCRSPHAGRGRPPAAVCLDGGTTAFLRPATRTLVWAAAGRPAVPGLARQNPAASISIILSMMILIVIDIITQFQVIADQNRQGIILLVHGFVMADQILSMEIC